MSKSSEKTNSEQSTTTSQKSSSSNKINSSPAAQLSPPQSSSASQAVQAYNQRMAQPENMSVGERAVHAYNSRATQFGSLTSPESSLAHNIIQKYNEGRKPLTLKYREKIPLPPKNDTNTNIQGGSDNEYTLRKSHLFFNNIEIPIKVRFLVTPKMLKWTPHQVTVFVLMKACNATQTQVEDFLAQHKELKWNWQKKNKEAFEGFKQASNTVKRGQKQQKRIINATFSVPAQIVAKLNAYKHNKIAPKQSQQQKEASKQFRQVMFKVLDKKQQTKLIEMTLRLYRKRLNPKEGTPTEEMQQNPLFQELLDQLMIIYFQSQADIGALKHAHSRTYLNQQIISLKTDIAAGTPHGSFQDYLEAYYTYLQIAQSLDRYSPRALEKYKNKSKAYEQLTQRKYSERDQAYYKVLQKALEGNQSKYAKQVAKEDAAAQAQRSQIAYIKEALTYAGQRTYGIALFWELPQAQRDVVVAAVKKDEKYRKVSGQLFAQAVRELIAENKRTIARQQENEMSTELQQKRRSEGKTPWTRGRRRKALKRKAQVEGLNQLMRGFASEYDAKADTPLAKMHRLIQELEQLKVSTTNSDKAEKARKKKIKQIRFTLKQVYQQLPKLYDDKGNRISQDKQGTKKVNRGTALGMIANTGTFEQRLSEVYFEKYLVFKYIAKQRDKVVHTLSASDMQNLKAPHQNGQYTTQELAGLTASGTRQSVVLSARGVMQNYHEALDELKIVARAYLLNEDVTKLGVADTLGGKIISGLNELLSSSLEGLLESTLGVHIASNQDLVSAFVANMQGANIALSEQQLRDAKASLANKIGQSIGQSIPVMFEIAFTSAITGALGEIKAIAQASKVVFNTLKYAFGNKGEKAYKVFASMLKGAVSYGMAGQSKAAGAGEGMVQSLINEDVLNKLKGKFGVFFTFGLRVMAGATTETLQEYAGNFADQLVQTNFDWSKACKATFGASFGEATDRLLVTAITSALFSGAFNAGTLAGSSTTTTTLATYQNEVAAIEANSQALKTAKAYALGVIDAAMGKANVSPSSPSGKASQPKKTPKHTQVKPQKSEVKKFKTEEEQRLGVFIRQKDGKRFIRVLHSLATATDVVNQVKANVVLTHEAAHAFVDDMSAVEKQAFLDAIYLASAQAGTGAFDPNLMEELAVEYIAQQYVKQQVETNAILARAKAATLLQQFKQFLRKLAAQLRNGIRGVGFVSTEGQIKKVLDEMMEGFIKQNKLNPEQLAQFDYLDNFNTWLHSPAKNQTSKKGEEVKKFTYGGINSKLVNTKNDKMLDKALNMWAGGHFTEDQIWKETGWYRGKEGLWRFEIDDSKAKLDIDRMTKLNNKKITFGGKKIKLTKILNHPTLYKHYPFLKKVKVILSNGSSADADKKIIKLNFDKIDDPNTYPTIEGNPTTFEGKVKSILLHEVQHLIQDKEDFAKGTSGKTFNQVIIRLSEAQRPTNRGIQGEINRMIDKIHEKIEDKLNKLPDEDHKKRFKELWEKFNELGWDFQKYNEKGEPLIKKDVSSKNYNDFFDIYWDPNYAYIWEEFREFEALDADRLYELTMGEAESRDVQWRMFLNEQERKARLPFTDLVQTEGYNPKYLILNTKISELNQALEKLNKLLKSKGIDVGTKDKID